jgi:ATP-binding cassette subfamily B protein
MFRIIKYLKKSWGLIFIILLLFCNSAYCDLTLPKYTSNIVDVGISKRGIDETSPVKKGKAAWRIYWCF